MLFLVSQTIDILAKNTFVTSVKSSKNKHLGAQLQLTHINVGNVIQQFSLLPQNEKSNIARFNISKLMIFFKKKGKFIICLWGDVNLRSLGTLQYKVETSRTYAIGF
jgi:hypothetical protein